MDRPENYMEDTGTMEFTYECDELVKPKYSVGTKVKVYRAFQGYCGEGIIVQSMPSGLIPTYRIKLLNGNYLGKLAPVEFVASEDNIEPIK